MACRKLSMVVCMVHPERRLDQELLEIAVARGARTERVPDLAGHAIRAGTSIGVRERVWALIKFAADLRALENPDQAIRVLRAAWEMDLDDETELALFTCAIAAHRDLGDLDTAQRLVDYQRPRASDELFESAAAAVAHEIAARETQTAA